MCFKALRNPLWMLKTHNTPKIHEDRKWFGEAKEYGKDRVWIPLVSPTYQVVSVLLHCLTAEKPDKTRGGWGRDRQRGYCSSDQTEMNFSKRVTGHLTTNTQRD